MRKAYKRSLPNFVSMKLQPGQIYDPKFSDFHIGMTIMSDLAKINKKFEVSSPYTGPYAPYLKYQKLLEKDGTISKKGYDMVEIYNACQENRITNIKTGSAQNLTPIMFRLD